MPIGTKEFEQLDQFVGVAAEAFEKAQETARGGHVPPDGEYAVELVDANLEMGQKTKKGAPLNILKTEWRVIDGNLEDETFRWDHRLDVNPKKGEESWNLVFFSQATVALNEGSLTDGTPAEQFREAVKIWADAGEARDQVNMRISRPIKDDGSTSKWPRFEILNVILAPQDEEG